MYLAAQIEYLNGRYTQSEALYNHLIELYPNEYEEIAEADLTLVYYQTNEYHKTVGLSAGQDDMLNVMLAMMQSFGEIKPYQLNWNVKDEAIAPFVVDFPLPVVRIYQAISSRNASDPYRPA